MKHLLVEIAHKGALDDLYGESNERWTQSPVFIDVFTRRALASSQLVRPGAFIRESVREQSKVVDRARDALDFLFLFPQASSSSSKPSRNDEYRIYPKNKRIHRVELDYPSIKSNEREDQKQQIKRLPPSSGWFLSVLTTPASSSWKSVKPHTKALNVKTTGSQLPVLKIMMKHHTLAMRR